jgi:hypothetical protein
MHDVCVLAGRWLVCSRQVVLSACWSSCLFQGEVFLGQLIERCVWPRGGAQLGRPHWLSLLAGRFVHRYLSLVLYRAHACSLLAQQPAAFKLFVRVLSKGSQHPPPPSAFPGNTAMSIHCETCWSPAAKIG